MPRSKTYSFDDFYCTQCGEKGIPILRQLGKERNAGHLKKLYCLRCGKETNFCEIKPNCTKYTYQDFLLEKECHNFDTEGNRILPFGIFKDKLVKEHKYEPLQNDI